MLKRLSGALFAPIADLWWSVEDRFPMRSIGAVLVLVAFLVGLKVVGWLGPVLYAIPIVIGAVVGLVFVSLALAFDDEGGDDLEDWFWIGFGAVVGGLAGWGVSALIAWVLW